MKYRFWISFLLFLIVTISFLLVFNSKFGNIVFKAEAQNSPDNRFGYPSVLTGKATPANVTRASAPYGGISDYRNDKSITNKEVQGTSSLNIAGQSQQVSWTAIYGPSPNSPVTEGGNSWYALKLDFNPSGSSGNVYVPKSVTYRIEFKDYKSNVLKTIDGQKNIEGGKTSVWIYGVYQPEEFRKKIGNGRYRMYSWFWFDSGISKSKTLHKKGSIVASRAYQSAASSSGGGGGSCGGVGPGGGGPKGGDPVGINTGSLVLDYVDFSLPGNLEITRHYDGGMLFQPGRVSSWRFNFEEFLRFDPYDGSIFYSQIDFKESRFVKKYPQNPSSKEYVASKPWNLLKLRVLNRGQEEVFEITFKNRTKKVFNRLGYLIETVDEKGNVTSYEWQLALDNINKIFFDVPREILTLLGPCNNIRRALTIKDPYNRKVYVYFDDRGLVSSIKDWSGRTASYDWGQEGACLVRFTDVGGNLTTFDYNFASYRQLKSIRYPNGAQMVNYYMSNESPNASVVSYQQFADGRKTTYNYGWLASPDQNWTTINESGKQTTYHYDDYGNIAKITGPEGRASKFTYDSNTHLLTSLTDPMENTYKISYDENKNLAQIINPKGASIKFKFDEKDRFTDYWDELKRHVHYEYDKDNLTWIENKDYTKRNFEYNPMGQITKFIDENEYDMQFKYDDYGNLTEIKDQEGGIITAKYNLFGLPVYINENGLETRFRYNNFNKITEMVDGLNNRTVFSYDRNGNISSVVDAEGNTYTAQYDVFDRLIRLTEPGSITTGYNYNYLDKIGMIVDPKGLSINFKYYLTGSLKSTSGQLSLPSRETLYAYDKNNNVTEVNRAGKRVTFRYDQLNRLIEKISDNNTRYAYDDAGNLLSTADNTGIITTSYDAMDRIIRMGYSFKNKTIERKYDKAGNIIYEKDIDGNEFDASYDEADKIKSITKKGSPPLKFAYNNNQDLYVVEYPNGVKCYYYYDGNKNIIRIKYVSGTGSVIYIAEYEYNKIGKVIRKKSSGLARSSRDVEYVYDKAGRLAGVKIAGSTSFLSSYTYDANGNRIEAKTSKGKVSYSYDSENQLLSAGSDKYNYDGAGNLISASGRNATGYLYDKESNLTGINYSTLKDSREVYAYEGLNNLRVKKSYFTGKTNKGTTYSFWLGRLFQGEFSEKGKPEFIDYGYGFKGPDGNDYYYMTDLIGSVMGLTDKNGELVSIYEYDEFGNIVSEKETSSKQASSAGKQDVSSGETKKPSVFTKIINKIFPKKSESKIEGKSVSATTSKSQSSGKISSPRRFAGYFFDEKSGLYYLKSRYYSPELGRFIQPDKIGYEGGLNLYSYCLNDPVNFIDSEGTCMIMGRIGIPGGTLFEITKPTPSGTWVPRTSAQPRIVQEASKGTETGTGGNPSPWSQAEQTTWSTTEGGGGFFKSMGKWWNVGSGVGASGITGTGGSPAGSSSQESSKKSGGGDGKDDGKPSWFPDWLPWWDTSNLGPIT